LATILFGWINEQRGTKETLKISIGVTAAIPALAQFALHHHHSRHA
jgi:hypothetical protein